MTERTEKVVVMIFVLFLVCSISIHAALKIGPTSSTCNKVVAFHDRLNSGLVSYADGLVLQKDMHDRVVAAQFLSSLTQRETVKVGEVLLLQHPSVYTTGTATKPTSGPFSKVTSDGEILNYEIVKVDRAGDITYHGPGQLVLYPVIDLNYFGNDIHWYLRALEQVVINVAEEVGVPARRINEPGYTGVWVNNAKVAAIGLKISRWVTTHGVSLNVSPDMRYFDNIVPCGISDADKRVGSLQEFCPSATVASVAAALKRQFLLVMNVKVEENIK